MDSSPFCGVCMGQAQENSDGRPITSLEEYVQNVYKNSLDWSTTIQRTYTQETANNDECQSGSPYRQGSQGGTFLCYRGRLRYTYRGLLNPCTVCTEYRGCALDQHLRVRKNKMQRSQGGHLQ